MIYLTQWISSKVPPHSPRVVYLQIRHIIEERSNVILECVQSVRSEIRMRGLRNVCSLNSLQARNSFDREITYMMHLINIHTMKLEEFASHLEKPYFILSHRWEQEEVTYEDMISGHCEHKKGYRKIQAFCDIIRAECSPESPSYVWVDTCCIDKKSSAELSEAINSMYTWYENALCCYAFLSDVDTLNDLENSLWFTRCWTLQELIAPRSVLFVSKRWEGLGSRESLAQEISTASNIDASLLEGTSAINDYSVAQRMSWAAGRQATRPEDEAYSLMGLFDVNMPMLYGEGRKAFRRLQEEIISHTNDHTIFAWPVLFHPQLSSMIADSPDAFRGCGDIVRTSSLDDPEGYSIMNVGLSIHLMAINWQMDVYCAILECAISGIMTHNLGILLWRSPITRRFARLSSEDYHPILIARKDWFVERTSSYQTPRSRRFLVYRGTSPVKRNSLYGFCLESTRAPTRSGFVQAENVVTTGVWDVARRIAYMRTGTMGTACIIQFDRMKATLFRSIRLGFDEDFNAVVEISDSYRHKEELYSNEWLRQASDLGGRIEVSALLLGRSTFNSVVYKVSRDVGLDLVIRSPAVRLVMEWREMTGSDDTAWHVSVNSP